jgi:hypothetical protein
MKGWSVVCFGKVLVSFFTRDDAELAVLLIKRLSGLDCVTAQDTRSCEYVFKDSASTSLINFLDLLSDL